MILTDTCVLIEYFKGNPDAVKTVNDTGVGNIVLNSIIVMELLVGARDKVELNSIKKRLNKFQTIDIGQPVLDDAEALLESYYLSHGLKIADAIIAATSRYHKIPLYTFNKKDFQFISDIKVFK